MLNETTISFFLIPPTFHCSTIKDKFLSSYHCTLNRTVKRPLAALHVVTQAYPYEYPKAMFRISAGHESKAKHSPRMQWEGCKEGTVKSALFAVKSSDYLSSSVGKGQAASTWRRHVQKRGKAAALATPLLQGQCSPALLNALPRCSFGSAPSPSALCPPPKLRKHSKKNTLL